MTSTTAWILGLFSLALVIALAQSIPVEIVYTGEAGCDCPTKLDYQLNVPKPPKCKKHSVNEYGYKVVEPVAAKAKVSYSFDFTVEEPKTPAPPKTKKWDLYAKVDRIAVNKGDCGQPESSCTCGQCGITKPQYRYVYKRLRKPCSCQKPNCTCDQRRGNFVVEAVQVPANTYAFDGATGDDSSDGLRRPGNNIRRKRDLNESAFRPRKGDGGRLVKLYQKNIGAKAKGLFGWPDFKKPALLAQKKTLFGRIVKRDIKGEYDLIEDDRQKLDLTVPEIIQYMPETLRPNFKRNAKCYFGCDKEEKASKEAKTGEQNIFEDSGEQPADEEDKPFKASLPLKKPPKYYKKSGSNALGPDPASVSASGDSVYTKRQAAQYNYQITSSCPTSQSQSPSSPANSPASATYAANAVVPLFQTNSAYAAQSAQYASPQQQQQQYDQQQQYTRLAQKSTNPIQLLVGGHRPQKTSYSAVNEATANGGGAGLLSPDYLYDQLGQKYVERDCNGCVRVIAATPTVPDPNAGVATVGGVPMTYAGDLDTPLQRYTALLRESQQQQRGGPYDQESVSSHQYPVQHISNDQLDKIIAEIVYRHPDFIEATAHEGGALVDPEPWQEEETKDFIKKLLDGRLDLWFGGHEEYVNVQQRPGGSYDAKYYYHYAQNRPKERQSSGQQYQQQPQAYQQPQSQQQPQTYQQPQSQQQPQMYQPQTYQQPQNEKQSQPQQYEAPPQPQKYEAPPQPQIYEQPQPQKPQYEQPQQQYTPPQQNTQQQHYTQPQQNTQQQHYTQPQQNTQQQPQQYPQAKHRNTYNIYSRKIVGSYSDEY